MPLGASGMFATELRPHKPRAGTAPSLADLSDLSLFSVSLSRLSRALRLGRTAIPVYPTSPAQLTETESRLSILASADTTAVDPFGKAELVLNRMHLNGHLFSAGGRL